MYSSCVDTHFISPRIEQLAHIFNFTNAATDSQWNKYLRCNLLDNRDNRIAIIRTGGDVQKRYFISTGFVVAAGDTDRVACITNFKKFHSLDDSPGIDIKTGNNAFGKSHIKQRPMCEKNLPTVAPDADQ